MRASVYHEVGGLDEGLRVAFNDIDLCLRIREMGYRNLWTPFAELYHYASATRGYENTPEKIERLKRAESFRKDRLKDARDADPSHTPNSTLHSTPFPLAKPPPT